METKLKLEDNIVIEQLSINDNAGNNVAFLLYQKARGKNNHAEQLAIAKKMAASPLLYEALHELLNEIDRELSYVSDEVKNKAIAALKAASE